MSFFKDCCHKMDVLQNERLLQPPSTLDNSSEDLKFHVAGSRNRKRVINEEPDLKDPAKVLARSYVPSSNETAGKRRRIDSSSDEEDERNREKNGGGEPTRSPAQNFGDPTPSTSAGNVSEEPEEDPWAHLEELMAVLETEFPKLDSLTIQDALIQNEVCLEKARRTLGGENSCSSFKVKSKKAADGDGFSDKEKYRLISDNVYDSDESDDEEETFDRVSIVQFLNAATLPDLLKLRGLSERKAAILAQARPFTNWKHMLSVVRATKYLNLDTIIDATKDYLNSRTSVSKIIHRCQAMAEKIEHDLANITETTEQPKMIAEGMKLQGYQIYALQWLSMLHKNNMNGILADEMGLGKTIQSIAFIARLMEEGIHGPFLIVAPASTIDNWDDEFRRWAPAIRTVVYHGSLEDRAFLRQEYFSPKGLNKMEVVITTYDGATRNLMDKAAFRRLHFKYAIFDEAHLLKNMATQKYRVLLSTIHANNRLLLTGTPVQNNLTELLSLLVFAMPNMLSKETGSLEHAFTYITKGSATEYEAQQVSEAKAILKPFILRRTKADVALELPGKTAKVEFVAMSASQERMYEKMVRRYSKDRVVEEGDEDAYTGEGLEALHQLRKLANHPLLVRNIFTNQILPELAGDLIKFDRNYRSDTAEHLAVDLEFKSDFQLHQLCLQDRNFKKYRVKSEHILNSGKFEFLDRMLPDLKEQEHRVLLFSQYTQILDIIESFMTLRHHKYARIDGSTPVAERQDIVDRFNSDDEIFVMLLSTRAGGLGINLTGADTVIIHDVDFNPYNDKQAENRCHRLGQKKEVTVYRLISKDTIETSIFEMGQKKLQLERNLIEENDGSPESTPVTKQPDEDVDVETVKAILHNTFSASKA